MNITKEQLEKMEERLVKEKTEFKKKLAESEKTADFGDDVDNFEEEADEAEEISNKLGVGKIWKEKLADIERALEKIKDGEFGSCEKCYKDIETEVLEAEPASRLCRNCKKA